MGPMARELWTAGRILILAAAVALAGCEATDVQPISPVTELPSAPLPSPTASPSPAAARSPSPPTVRMDMLSGASAAKAGPGSYTYKVEVPQLEGLGAHATSIDNVIRASLQRVVDDFVAEARDASAGPATSDLACLGKAVRLTPSLAVLRVDCSERMAGVDQVDTAAHSFNCDLSGGRVLTLQDLFSSGSGYLDVLSAAARTQLRNRLPAGDDRTLDDGTAPVVDNFRAFLLERQGMVVVLPGRYRPAGTTAALEVTVPYGDLEHYFARSVSDLVKS